MLVLKLQNYLKRKDLMNLVYLIFWSTKDFDFSEVPFTNKNMYRGQVLRPTLQMACKWLREVHIIDIIAPPQYDSIKWTWFGIIVKLSIPCTEIKLNDNKDKKEEACEAALKYVLENLI